jgi:predicted aspartyl protease
LRALLLAGLLLCGGCASPRVTDPPERMLLDAPVVRIPLREEPDNLFSVEVYLEGAGPYRFLLDTGAGMTILDPVVAQRFLIEDQSLPFRLRGAFGGEPRAVPRGAIGEFSFQPADAPGARVHDVPFLAQAVPHSYDGVAGLGLFRGCRVVFDFPSRFVEASRPGRSLEDIPVADGTLPTVILGVEDASVEAVVDTGFSGVLYLPARHAAGLRTLGPAARVAVLTDVHGPLPVEERHLWSELRAGSGVVANPWILVGEGGALLGNGFLRAYRVVFDGRGRFVDVEAPR